MFQFLIGTVKTLSSLLLHHHKKEFQFLIGTVKTGKYGVIFAIDEFVSIPHRYCKNYLLFSKD